MTSDTHPYGPNWGSCAGCGGDRELVSLDEHGHCECCTRISAKAARAAREESKRKRAQLEHYWSARK
jgi:hypothetical protein